MRLDLTPPPGLTHDGLRDRLQAAAAEGWRVRAANDGWVVRAGAALAYRPDDLPFRLVLSPRPDGIAAYAEFCCAPWTRAAGRRIVLRRAEALLARLAGTRQESPRAGRRPDFPLRSFSVFLSLLLSTCAGIAVFWAYGLAVIDATPQPPPAWFGAARLAELPFATRFWTAWFVAFSMGYPLGFLAGLLCCAAEYLAEVAAVLLPLLAALGAWLIWMTFAPGLHAHALATGAALPAVCWAAYGLPWALRQEGDA